MYSIFDFKKQSLNLTYIIVNTLGNICMDNTNLYTTDVIFIEILYEHKPFASADVVGNDENPQLYGVVNFYDTSLGGVLIEANIHGLPNTFQLYSSNFYGFHIHEKGNCTKPFDKTGDHYNPTDAPHPNHAGDLPPLLGNQGFAYSVVYTHRFDINEIIGRSVVIHSNPDDFVTQPSGNSGTKIGCGIIKKK